MKDQKGQALIVVLLMTAVIFFIGAATLALAVSVRKNTAGEIAQKKAYYISDAGIEKVLALVAADSGWLEGLINGAEYNLVPDLISPAYADGTIRYVKVTKEKADAAAVSISIVSRGEYQRAYCELYVKAEAARMPETGALTVRIASWSEV